MEQLTIKVKNKSKIPFLKELLKQMDFVEIIEPKNVRVAKTKKEKFLKELQESIQEMKLIKAGKLKGIPAKDLLNEL